MKRWEYKLVAPKLTILYEQEFNTIGAEGWEFCGKDHGVYVFKRELLP